MEINELLEIAKKGNLTDCGQHKCAEIIKAQQQERDRLKELLADWKYNTKCDADHIAALTTDKDELVKVLKKAREALYAARVDVLTKETDELARDAVEAIDALIGGKQDV